MTLPDAALNNMAQEALDHLPDDKFDFSPLTTSSVITQLFDDLPDQTDGHVPSEIPPLVTLPEDAIGHMSDVANGQLHLHTDWFV